MVGEGGEGGAEDKAKMGSRFRRIMQTARCRRGQVMQKLAVWSCEAVGVAGGEAEHEAMA